MKLSIKEVAKIIQAEVSGDSSCCIEGVSSFSDATPAQITFASDPKFLNQLSLTNAAAVIVPDSFLYREEDIKNKIIIKSKNPKIDFFKIVNVFHSQDNIKPRIDHSACIGGDINIGIDAIIESNVFIGNQVTIGNHVRLMPGVFVGNGVSIGDHTIIKPNVTIMDKTQIGRNVIIHSGTVVGSDGFGFAQDQNKHEKLIHIGYVVIGDDTEIGACNTIDRGTLGITRIGCGVKTDNQVHIAHNVEIGDNTLLVAQVGIAGSTCIGKNVIIAGKSGITGHITIGDNTIVGPFTGVFSDVPQNQVVSGIPHLPHMKWKRMVSILSKLPEMRKKIFSFEKRLKDIELQNKRLE